MKKFFSLLLVVCMLLSMMTVMANATFPDLPEGHWAYSAVEKMRNDGRVNGFPDGTFKPDELVTRWQFAKMAGGDYDAVTSPDRPATRDEAAIYLWEMAGKPSVEGPSAVAKGSKKPEGITWAYTRGIMQGDDGFNLRLDSTLTRAEAATLIVRSEGELGYANFRDTVSQLILERVWNAMGTGIPYAPNTTVTGGQLARMALQIGYGYTEPTYLTMEKKPSFDGEYAKDVQVVAEECLGVDKATEAFMNDNVSVQEAVAVLSFYSMKQATGALKIDAKAKYSDANLTADMAVIGLQFARSNGVMLYAEPKLNATAELTLQDLSCILLQLDEIVGLTKAYGDEHNTAFLKEEYIWPSNAKDYAYILKEVPSWIYETPIVEGVKAKDYLEYGKNFAGVYADFLKQISANFPESVNYGWSFYPSLVSKSEDSFVIRVRLEMKKNPDSITLNELLPQNSFAETYKADRYILDIAVGTSAMDVRLDGSKYQVIRVFCY